MTARIFFTAAALLLALAGFFGATPTSAGPLNPFGIVFLALSGVIWLGWAAMQASYAYRDEIWGAKKHRLDMMVFALASVLKRPGAPPPDGDR